MTRYLIAVVGIIPGVGKSPLCRSLADWIRGNGANVDHFEEADILTRPAFRPVARDFADGTGSVHPETLIAATQAYVTESRTAGIDVLVTDALVPFTPSLAAWGRDEPAIAAFLRELASALGPTRVTVVYLHDDPSSALRRAIDREGPSRVRPRAAHRPPERHTAMTCPQPPRHENPRPDGPGGGFDLLYSTAG